MISIEVEYNLLPTIEDNLDAVTARRLNRAGEAAREAGRSGVDDPGLPESDTGALREGIVLQTEDGDDYDERRADALAAFTGNPSRFDPGGKRHTEEEFNRLCADMPHLPTSSTPGESTIAIVVLMLYGLWFEEGDAWDLANQTKRSPAPWFGPPVNAWGDTRFEGNFKGIVEEAAGQGGTFDAE